MFQFRFLFITVVATILVMLNSCGLMISSPSNQPTIAISKTEQDIAYLTTLGLMKGHLIVADELLEQGTPDQAEPHLGHPIEELYANVETELTTRKVPEFRKILEDLYSVAKYQPADPSIKTGYLNSIKAIDQAIEAVPESDRQSAVWVMGVMNEILNTVEAEYDAGIANNKIVARIEYQDSRGFVLYLEEFYRAIATKIAQQNPKAGKIIAAKLATLKTAFPSVNPPKTPVLHPNQVSKLVKEIQNTKLN